ncbi:MAG: UDP-N-acetylmuramoyl-L-alanyl-D-glutamate--2,6-diaminopimelate ligase [Candidatus Wildermuthbacteria bacterium]|nr:UDP-N-acetylmuramoyl-L-alanyl-D-glutamate--2,6-diaminopimelate ligase [Candidatus Wildermuthbacteria bacterium]
MKEIIRSLIPEFLLSWYHFVLALFGALWFQFPSKNLVVIGVTGTNGKSTTVDMLSRIFRGAGIKTASLSSIRFQILEKEWKNKRKMTMPGRFVIQKFLRDAKNAGCTHIVLEVTSEGILQHRHRFIRFDTAVFTNLSPEHIERHGSFEKYREAKGRLFETVKRVHVINADDENAAYFLKFLAEETFRYSLADAKGIDLRLKLLGEFNTMNALAAITVAKAYDIPFEVCKKALESITGVPGRMEVVIKEPFRVVVDYAFTPAALEKVYQALKPAVCVLGAAGGGRDRWKRPVLGGIAAKYCNKIIITNEDPYGEDPMKIIEEVAQGAGEKAEKILDRREAIRKALRAAQPGDTVVITGKGSEDSIAQAGKKISWDDREVVKEEFAKIVDKAGNIW